MSTPQAGEGGGRNAFSKKYGPLPLYAWAGIALVLILVYAKYSSNKKQQQTDTSTVNSPGGVDASLVPQFINQEYVNTAPPAAPNVTVNNQIPGPIVVPPGVPGSKNGPEPSTISSAPGSYTTGLAGGLNEWTSNGRYSLNTIARSHGMTVQQLIAISEKAENNPSLKAYVAKKNYNLPVPAGVHLFIPNANWPTRNGATPVLSHKGHGAK